MNKYRGFLIWSVSALLIVGVFIFFVKVGWPGEPSGCIFNSPDTCYCEAFVENEILSYAPGVRQPVNTWSNLYAIFSSLLVAIFVYSDRKKLKTSKISNLMRSFIWVPDLYIFIVLFLGLGSMWFHGSLTDWGGLVDGVSMFMFTVFLIFYTIRRNWNSGWFFWIGYLLFVTLFSAINALTDLPSYITILTTVAIYLIAEIYTWKKKGRILHGKSKASLLWVFAVMSILTATFFWVGSQTGNFMCDPNSFFQPHGLLWHPLAGVTAVLLYFYWRHAEDYI